MSIHLPKLFLLMSYSGQHPPPRYDVCSLSPAAYETMRVCLLFWVIVARRRALSTALQLLSPCTPMHATSASLVHGVCVGCCCFMILTQALQFSPKHASMGGPRPQDEAHSRPLIICCCVFVTWSALLKIRLDRSERLREVDVFGVPRCEGGAHP